MKLKEFLYTKLLAAALCWGIMLASLLCTITSYDLSLNLPQLASGLGAVAFLWAVGSTARRHKLWIVLLIATMGALLYLFRGSVGAGGRAAMNIILQRLSKAYSWCPDITFRDAGSVQDVTAFFLALGSIGVSASVFDHCRLKGCVLTILMAIPFFLLSVSVVNHPPSLAAACTLFGLLLLLVLTQSVRTANPVADGRLKLMLAVPVLLLTALLAAKTPTDGTQRIDLADRLMELFSHDSYAEYTTRTTGRALWLEKNQTVDFTELGELHQSFIKVMDVTADMDGPLYLRGLSMGDYTKTGWDSCKKLPEPPLPDGIEDGPLPNNGPDWLPVEQVTVSTIRAQDVVYLTNRTLRVPTGQVYRDCYVENNEQEMDYSFYCVPYTSLGIAALEDDECVTAFSSTYPDVFSSTATFAPSNEFASKEYTDYVYDVYTRLPDSTKEQLLQIAEEEGFLGQRKVDTARAVAQFYQSGTYTLSPELMPEDGDFAVWFTTESMKGYCVHFATSATAMLRALGIPARFVSGYMTIVEANKPVTVTGKQAHAWVEYYDDVLGWIPLEVTPASPDEPEPPTVNSSTEPTASTAPTAPEPTAPTEPTEPIATTNPSKPSTSSEQEPASLSWLLWLTPIVGIAMILGLLELQRMLRRCLVIRRLQRVKPNRQAEMLWGLVLLLQRRSQIPLRPEMEQLAQQAKYSGRQIPAEALRELRRYVTWYYRECRAQLGRVKGLLARWLWAW